jgi:hypothetical protein
MEDSQIWSIFSDTPITTLECGMAELTSVHYFVVHGNQEFIVAGSASGTACVSQLHYSTISDADIAKNNNIA